MANQLGKRYICSKCGSEFIVTRKGDGTIHCCGQPMDLKKQKRGSFMANLLGKRYLCETCGTEVLCTKQGDGAASCCDKDMVEQQPRPLPSSD